MSGVFSWDWYYNHKTGVVTQMIGLEADGLRALGVISGPFATKQDAINFYTANKSAHPSWPPPIDPGNVTGIVGNVVSQESTATKQQANNAVSGAVSTIFGNAANPSTIETWFIRIGEILLGLVLIAVGVVGLTRVKTTVKTAGKAAIAAAA